MEATTTQHNENPEESMGNKKKRDNTRYERQA